MTQWLVTWHRLPTLASFFLSILFSFPPLKICFYSYFHLCSTATYYIWYWHSLVIDFNPQTSVDIEGQCSCHFLTAGGTVSQRLHSKPAINCSMFFPPQILYSLPPYFVLHFHISKIVRHLTLNVRIYCRILCPWKLLIKWCYFLLNLSVFLEWKTFSISWTYESGMNESPVKNIRNQWTWVLTKELKMIHYLVVWNNFFFGVRQT